MLKSFPTALLALNAALVITDLRQSSDMRRLETRAGIVIELPRAWVLRDSSELRGVNDTAMQVIRGVSPEFVPKPRDLSRAGTLLVADGPHWTAATLGIGPGAGLTPRTFANYTPKELDAHRDRICRLITEAQRVQSLPPPRCGELTRDSVNGRAALVMQYDREGRTGPVHVYVIQVPTTDALVNLTLMSRVDAAKTNEPLFQRIWRSLVVPDTLGPGSSADAPH